VRTFSGNIPDILKNAQLREDYVYFLLTAQPGQRPVEHPFSCWWRSTFPALGETVIHDRTPKQRFHPRRLGSSPNPIYPNRYYAIITSLWGWSGEQAGFPPSMNSYFVYHTV